MNRKDCWVKFALQAMRVQLMKYPYQWFTAETFVDSLGPDLGPLDARWSGAVFQQAKREGLIRQATVNGLPATCTTRAGHATPVWTGARQ